MKKKMIRVACLLLAVIIMLCPLSVCFAVSEVVSTEIIHLLWETLKAWGITIVENGISEFTQNIEYWLNDKLEDYLVSEANEALDAYITGIEWTVDTFGRKVLNGLGVSEFYNFALWLKTQLNLSDNQTNALPSGNGQIEINSVIGYADSIGLYYYAPSYNWFYTYDIIKSNIDYPVFCFAYYNNAGGYGRVSAGAYSETPFVVQSTYVSTQNNEPVYNNYTSIEYNGYYFVFGLAGQTYNYFKAYNELNNHRYGDNPYVNDMSEEQIRVALAGNFIPAEGPDVNINTGSISFPPSDPTYQNGYSMIYYDDGSVAYLDINWPTTMTVDNLPAIVSTGTLANPGIQSVFLPIKAFITTFEDGFGLMSQLVYNLPSEIVGMALAIMGAIIIFGTIKIMKEH